MEEKLEIFTNVKYAIDFVRTELYSASNNNFFINVYHYYELNSWPICDLRVSILTDEEWSNDEEPLIEFGFDVDYKFTEGGKESVYALQKLLTIDSPSWLRNSIIKTDIKDFGEGNNKGYRIQVKGYDIPLSTIERIISMVIRFFYPDIPDSAVCIDITDFEDYLMEKFEG